MKGAVVGKALWSQALHMKESAIAFDFAQVWREKAGQGMQCSQPCLLCLCNAGRHDVSPCRVTVEVVGMNKMVIVVDMWGKVVGKSTDAVIHHLDGLGSAQICNMIQKRRHALV